MAAIGCELRRGVAAFHQPPHRALAHIARPTPTPMTAAMMMSVGNNASMMLTAQFKASAASNKPKAAAMNREMSDSGLLFTGVRYCGRCRRASSSISAERRPGHLVHLPLGLTGFGLDALTAMGVPARHDHQEDPEHHHDDDQRHDGQ